MKLDFGLNLLQEQKLIMTQEMQLSIRLLQMNTYELHEYVEEQVQQNPLLEFDELQDSNIISDFSIDEQRPMENNTKIEYDSSNDYDYAEEYYYNHEYFIEQNNVSPLNFISKKKDLWEYLKEQLDLSDLTKEQYKIGNYIIDSIDENGYLIVGIDEISAVSGYSAKDIEEIILIIQSYEPAGICARNLKECLRLQVMDMGISNDKLNYIIDNMLIEVSENKFSKIAEVMKISIQEAMEYKNLIKGLNPKPGLNFCNDSAKYIIPDIIIKKNNDRFDVIISEEGVSKVRVNTLYRDFLKNKDHEENKYISERLQDALWLVKCIEQRRETLKKVVYAIIDFQMDFFTNNGELIPLTLKQIGKLINMHESTISRAVNGKYAETPRGIYELKSFLIRGIQNNAGAEISVNKIKKIIKQIIKDETPENPYSDAQLTVILNQKGMNISRRTVAKYREELNIPSSSKRKVKKV